MPTIKSLFALLVSWAISFTASAGTFTDMWSDPQEPGWGMSLVQQGDTAFATLLVYDRDGSPRWYFASAARVVAGEPDRLPTFMGDLFRANGPWFGGPFDPANVAVAPVGHLRLVALANGQLGVIYDVDGVAAIKQVSRLTWSIADFPGLYDGAFRLDVTTQQGTAVGTLLYNGDVDFRVVSGIGVLTVVDSFQRTCVYRGAFHPNGSVASMAGTYQCTNTQEPSPEGTFELSELEATTNGLTGKLRTSSSAVIQSGRFGGLRYAR